MVCLAQSSELPAVNQVLLQQAQLRCNQLQMLERAIRAQQAGAKYPPVFQHEFYDLELEKLPMVDEISNVDKPCAIHNSDMFNLWITETLAELPDSGRLILVGHGLVMATLITRLLGLPFSGAPCMATHANTGVSNLRYVRDKGIGALPPEPPAQTASQEGDDDDADL